jgi:NAD+ kinase
MTERQREPPVSIDPSRATSSLEDASAAVTLIVDDASPKAREAAAALGSRYTFVEEPEAHVGVVLGGDGFMLRTLHRLLDSGHRLPVYGLNLGTVGFLLNRFELDGLWERLTAAEPTVLHPLRMRAEVDDGRESSYLAVNEVSLLRASAQSAHVRIMVDGQLQVEDLYGDGVMVATSAGSTAYNRSAGGPIIPLSAPLLALTPLAVFAPRGWRGALLDAATTVHVEVLDAVKRPVYAAADHHEVGRVRAVAISQARDADLTLLFDPHHTLEGRILREQFR